MWKSSFCLELFACNMPRKWLIRLDMSQTADSGLFHCSEKIFGEIIIQQYFCVFVLWWLWIWSGNVWNFLTYGLHGGTILVQRKGLRIKNRNYFELLRSFANKNTQFKLQTRYFPYTNGLSRVYLMHIIFAISCSCQMKSYRKIVIIFRQYLILFFWYPVPLFRGTNPLPLDMYSTST